MSQKMLINAKDSEELRVARVEDGQLEAFYVETAARRQTRGNIYKGVVANIEPSLGAAFIDYGQPRHGFLQSGDIEPGLWPENRRGHETSIKDILRRGQELLVQVVKEPLGSKGSSLTTYLSVPGQALVLTMGRHLAGVSRKLEDETERKRLKAIVTEINLPLNLGIIARTAAAGRSKRELTASAKLLLRLFNDILKRGESAPARSLINCEEELAVRTVRDLFTNEVDEILVDNPEVLERIREFIILVNPRRANALRLYREQKPIFGKYDIEKQLESIYSPKVALPGGGSLVIHSTEALVSIDVNSGKALKGRELEETALAVNLEAAREIARQLRLRDLGGLVVIDFIDMRESKAKTQVQKILKEALKRDKAKTEMGRLSRFGLLELSRQRIRPSIEHGDMIICPHCQGRGILRTLEAAARLVLRALNQQLAKGDLRLTVNPEIARYLQNQRRAKLAALEAEYHICLEVAPDPALGAEEWKVEPLPHPWADNGREEVSEPPAGIFQQAGKDQRKNKQNPKNPKNPKNPQTSKKAPLDLPLVNEPAAEPAHTLTQEKPEEMATAVSPDSAAAGSENKKPRKPPARGAKGAGRAGRQHKSAEEKEQPASPPVGGKAQLGSRPAAEVKAPEPETAASSPELEPAKRSRRSGSARRRARKQKLAALNHTEPGES
jgi:ribonuclease E